jgi:S1-C subfamily serine protease
MLTAAAVGCGHERHEESSGPIVSRDPIVSVEAPDPQLTNAPAVAVAKASVVKIGGNAPNCVLGGAGFVVAPNRVMTPAHIVAGGQTFTVEVDGHTFDADLVSYNSYRDLAILAVSNLPAPPLAFAAKEAVAGSDAIVLGYSDAGDFAVIPARIREVIELKGPDIDHTTTVSREVYTIRGGAEDSSGGPLIDGDGNVLGVAFGTAHDDPDTSFVLTAKEIAPQLADLTNSAPVTVTGHEHC